MAATDHCQIRRRRDTVSVRAHAPVNKSGWRYRCPENHANLMWSSSALVRCRSCGQGYSPGEIRDMKSDGTLEEVMNDVER